MSGNVYATDAAPLCHAICDKLNNSNKYGKNDVGSFDGRIANCWQANFILSNSPLHGYCIVIGLHCEQAHDSISVCTAVIAAFFLLDMISHTSILSRGQIFVTSRGVKRRSHQ